MEDKIQSFRQPLVTATGIILGFILNFATSFVKTDTDMSDFSAYVVGISILLGVICLILVLARSLRMSYPRAETEAYYDRTLTLFIVGICLAFTGVMVDMFSNFMS